MSFYNAALLSFARLRRAYLFSGNFPLVQENFLLSLLQKNRSTQYGKTHHFNGIQKSEDFLSRVPPTGYEGFKPYIDRMVDGEKTLLFHGSPVCFGRTTGTTGQPKLIPLNSKLLHDSRMSAVDAVLLGGLKHGSLRWISGKTLYIGPRKGTPMGKWMVYAEGTAFAYLQSPKWFVPDYTRLPAEKEHQDHAFLSTLTDRCSNIAGNPVEIADFLSSKTLPGIEVIFNCGCWAADFSTIYSQALPNVHVIDVYGSNEGTWGLPVEPGTFLLNCRRIFFSFLPLDGSGPAISLQNVKLNRKYELCVTTRGGLWNYRTGDIVAISSLTPPLVRLCGRKERILSPAMITEDEVVSAVKPTTPNYYLTHNKNKFYLHTDAGNPAIIDNRLCRINPDYRRLRENGMPALEIIRFTSPGHPKKPIHIRQAH